MNTETRYTPDFGRERQQVVSFLVLARHGESEYNQQGLWTGWTDVPLTEKGKADARNAGTQLHDIIFDRAYTSTLSRAKNTLSIMQEELGIADMPTVEHDALRERHYGDYTGKNKWQIKEEVGEEKFKKIRRGWDEPIPSGEASRDVYDRVNAYYENEMLPRLKKGENILVAAHGNSIRALAKRLEGLSIEEFMDLEVGIGEVHIYLIDKRSGEAVAKSIRAENQNKGKV